MNLSAGNVEKTMMECLFNESEVPDGKPPEDAIVVKGIIGRFAFHPGRVEEAKPRIAAMLRDLPDEFLSSGGGGWSFLNMCMDREGTHWGEHRSMEALIVLAIAAGYGDYCLPREYWDNLPGSMPYVRFSPPPK